MTEEILFFEMKNFWALCILTVYWNILKIRRLIQIKLCRNASMQADQSKNNSFLTEEAINYIAHTEKRKKVQVCEMLESSAFLSSFIMETEERQVCNSFII